MLAPPLDQATPSIRRETNYVEQDESEEIENQNMGPQRLADEGERIHSIVDEMEAEDQTTMEMEEYEGSSDDEQYSLPKEWKEHGFAKSFYDTYLVPAVTRGQRIMQRVFFCIGACVRAF